MPRTAGSARDRDTRVGRRSLRWAGAGRDAPSGGVLAGEGRVVVGRAADVFDEQRLERWLGHLEPGDPPTAGERRREEVIRVAAGGQLELGVARTRACSDDT